MAAESVPFALITRLTSPPTPAWQAMQRQRLGQRRLPAFLSSHQDAAPQYQPSDALLLAINMALHTGSPLLLTGEPGTGKTQAAAFIGAFFGIPVHTFLVKSTSTAQDLLYEFDAVGYLHWAQAARQAPPSAPEAIAAETQAVRLGFLHKRALWLAYETEGEAVVLIDEIDKAPRDFPNDLLHELDQHSFPHPFDHTQRLRPRTGRPPIVVITSNEERRLPDAFLRRCLFHRIELTEPLVEAAVESLAGEPSHFPHLDAATRALARRRFWDLRALREIEKKPSTAELLTWLCILSAQGVDARTLAQRALRDLPGIEALIKDHEDLRRLGPG